MQRFIDNAHVKPTDRVLKIGTGCTVTTTTLSPEQRALAQQRIRAAGLAHRITVLQTDYRNLQIPATGPYGKIISIEMLEAVGAANLETYFAGIDRLLKRDGGVAALQCTTIPDARHPACARSDDSIRRYVLPAATYPPSRGALVIDSVENIGRTTPRHCGCGARRSCASPTWRSGRRCGASMWGWGRGAWRSSGGSGSCYFAYSEAGFATGTLGDVVVPVAREGAAELVEDVPL